MKKVFQLKSNSVIDPLEESLTSMDLVGLYLSNFTKSTQRSYRAVLLEWVEYFDGKLTGITRNQAIRYFLDQQNKPGQKSRIEGASSKLTPETIQRKRLILKGFYRFLEGEGMGSAKIFEFPLQQGQRATKRPTECLPLHKIEELLSLHRGHTKTSLRDKAILHHLFFTGCRRAEICSFLIGHFKLRSDGTGEVISVSTKGGLPFARLVPKECASVMHQMAAQRLAEGFSKGDPMYPTYWGENGAKKPVSPKWLYRHFKRWCAEVGIDSENVSPHTARVTLATKLLLDTDGDYNKVSAVTGHKSFDILRRYDHRFKRLEDNPGVLINWSQKELA